MNVQTTRNLNRDLADSKVPSSSHKPFVSIDFAGKSIDEHSPAAFDALMLPSTRANLLVSPTAAMADSHASHSVKHTQRNFDFQRKERTR